MPRSSASRPPAPARAAESASVREAVPSPGRVSAPEPLSAPDLLSRAEHLSGAEPLSAPDLLSGAEPLAPRAPGEAHASTAALVEAPRGRERTGIRARVRTFSCTDRDMEMLERIAEYHGFSKSAMIASLVRREFWRIFPSGTPELRPDPGARIDD